ncbi:hypothetical protein [Helicobacter mustelae]|nr:hypothetical protein [Helicobacter mustelae]SQH72027.1 Uncharacterised protein [Helicobacter mustelae]STP13170.1 Uncharacterised protein [Helicobacter mustelae]
MKKFLFFVMAMSLCILRASQENMQSEDPYANPQPATPYEEPFTTPRREAPASDDYSNGVELTGPNSNQNSEQNANSDQNSEQNQNSDQNASSNQNSEQDTAANDTEPQDFYIPNQTRFGYGIVGIAGGLDVMTAHLDSNKNSNRFALSYGIKAGYAFIIKPEHSLRLFLDYNLDNFFASGRSYAFLQMLLLNLDYKYSLTQLVDVFVGINGNSAWLKTHDHGNSNSFGVGANIGMIFNLLSYLELEARLRFESNSFRKHFTQNGVQHKITFDGMLNFTVGINFKF